MAARPFDTGSGRVTSVSWPASLARQQVTSGARRATACHLVFLYSVDLRLNPGLTASDGWYRPSRWLAWVLWQF
jgi:hypothetical protein